MAIKNRRGIYSKFDPSKLLPGEWAVVLSGDPNAADGRACYMCFESGEVKRMATYDDMVDNIAASAGDAVAAEIDKQCKEAIANCQEATTNANTATNAASEATTQASNAAATASTAASNADTAAENANAATTAAQKVIQGDLSANTVTFTATSSRTAPATGESLGTLFGKIAKWLADLKAAAFCTVANNLTTTASGSVLDARQGKTLSDKLGTTDISAIGDGTVTGAVSKINAAVVSKTSLKEYNATSNAVEFSHINPGTGTVPRTRINSSVIIDSIPNNASVNTSNNKITDMYVDYSASPWKLVVKVYIDGTIYTKKLNFDA